jgi:hypothetical protein
MGSKRRVSLAVSAECARPARLLSRRTGAGAHSLAHKHPSPGDEQSPRWTERHRGIWARRTGAALGRFREKRPLKHHMVKDGLGAGAVVAAASDSRMTEATSCGSSNIGT